MLSVVLLKNMENTKENKEKFFALYLGQKVLNVGMQGIVTLDKAWNWKHEDFKLKLKPFSKINEEDLFQVLKASDREFMDEEYGTIVKVENIEMDDYFDLSVRVICEKKSYTLRTKIFHEATKVDVLRSLGYATPFLGLSIQDLISFGWLVLE